MVFDGHRQLADAARLWVAAAPWRLPDGGGASHRSLRSVVVDVRADPFACTRTLARTEARRP